MDNPRKKQWKGEAPSLLPALMRSGDGKLRGFAVRAFGALPLPEFERTRRVCREVRARLSGEVREALLAARCPGPRREGEPRAQRALWAQMEEAVQRCPKQAISIQD